MDAQQTARTDARAREDLEAAAEQAELELQLPRRRGRYEIVVENSDQPLGSEDELSKAMALAAAATASFGVVKVFSEVSHRVLATYVPNTKGEPVLI